MDEYCIWFPLNDTALSNSMKMTQETINIAKPLQNRQFAQTPYGYMGQIWHATVGQWSVLTGLMSSESEYCVANAGQKTAEISQFRPSFHNFIWTHLLSHLLGTKKNNFGHMLTFGGGGCCTQPPLPIRAKFGMLEIE